MSSDGAAYALREASAALDRIRDALATSSVTALEHVGNELARVADLMNQVVTQLRSEPEDNGAWEQAREIYRKAAQVRQMLEYGISYCDRRSRHIAAGGGYDQNGRSDGTTGRSRVAFRI